MIHALSQDSRRRWWLFELLQFLEAWKYERMSWFRDYEDYEVNTWSVIVHQLKYLKIREKICEILGEFSLQVSTKEPRKLYMCVLEAEIYDVFTKKLFTEDLYLYIS